MNSNLRKILTTTALIGGLTIAPAYAATASAAGPEQHPAQAQAQQAATEQALNLRADGLATQHAPVYVFADLEPGETAKATVEDLSLDAPLQNGAGSQVASLTAPVAGWGTGEHTISVLTSSGRMATTTFTAKADQGVTGELHRTGTGVQLSAANLPANETSVITVRDGNGAVVGTRKLNSDDRGQFANDVPFAWGPDLHTVSVDTEHEQATVWAQKVAAPAN